MGAIDDNLQVQAVDTQEDGRGRGRLAAIADEAVGVGERRCAGAGADDEGAALDRIGGGVGVRSGGQGRGLIQRRLGPGDHLVAAHRVVGAGAGRHGGSCRRFQYSG